jgi:hypothetical protein
MGAVVIAAVGTLVLLYAGLAWAAAQPAGEQRYPAGQEWMAGPPPPGVQVTLVKLDDVAVGLVLADGMQEGQTVSGTIVALTPKGSDISAAEGMVLVDPAGKEHQVEPGKVITFAVGAAAAISLSKGGNTLGTRNIPLEPAQTLPNARTIVQSDRLTNLTGTFDGNAVNSTAGIGDTPLKVIAESPTNLIVASPNLGELTGPVEIQIADGDRQSTVPANAIHLRLQAPTKMKLGQRTSVEVTLRGLQSLRGMKNTEAMSLYAFLANETPQNIALDKKAPTFRALIDPKKIGKDGTYRLRVPMTAIAPGAFRLVGTIISGPYRCKVSCVGCSGYWRCGDDGKVDCTGGGCMGGCGGHSGGAACGHPWTCDCKFRSCECER